MKRRLTMHKARVVILAGIVVCAALAAYFWWPSEAPQQPDPLQPAVEEPALPTLPEAPGLPEAELSDQEEAGPPRGDEHPEEPEISPEEPITSVANLRLPFFDDLAQRLVDRYHPAGTEHNAGEKGVLLLSLSAVNRAYGVDMIGLDHSSPSLLEAREEIFSALLQPETIEAAWQAFAAYFKQALIEQSLNAERSFAGPDGAYAERALSVQEASEFLRLASASMHRYAQAVRIYAQSDQSVAKTKAWLNARQDAMAANSRYQYAEDLLELTLLESPGDHEKITGLRQERDEAGQDILTAIATREHLKESLLTIYERDALTKNLFETDLLYVSQWLFRRLHDHPDRRSAFVILAERIQEFAADLHSASDALTAPAPE
jgi:hypothetical protein